MFAIYEILINCFSAYTGVDFITRFFSPKYSGWKRWSLFFGACVCYTIVLSIMNAITLYEGIAGFIYIAVLFLYARIALNGHMIEHFGVSMMWMFTVLLAGMLMGKITTFFAHITFNEWVQARSMLRVYALLIALLSKYLITRIILLIRMDKELALEKKESASFIVILIVIFFLLIGFMELEVIGDYDNTRMSVSILLMLALIVLILITYLFFRKLSNYRQKALEVEFLKRYMDEQRNSLTESIRKTEDIRIMRHDMKDFVNSIYLLLKAEKLDAAITYIEAWNVEMKKYQPISGLSANMGINAVLSKTIQDCRETGIEFDYEISGDVDKFQDLDMGILLANSLNNAEEACANIQKNAHIHLEIYNYQNYLTMIVKNSIAISVLSMNPELMTTKKDRTCHGYGMKSMERIVEKYDGMMKCEEEEKEFILRVMLKIPQQEETGRIGQSV